MTQFGSVCPPLEEDQLGGFKSPPAPDISDDFLGDTVWLTDMASTEEVLQPRKYVCPECYSDIFKGQTICLSRGYRIQYGTVDMEVDEDEDPAGDQGHTEVIRSISLEAIASREKKNVEARIKAAANVGKFGPLTQAKSEFGKIKEVFNQDHESSSGIGLQLCFYV